MKLQTALDELALALRDADVAAQTDARDLNTPGVWVTLDGISHELLSGDATVRVALFLIADDTGAAWNQLGDLLDQVLTVVDAIEDTVPVGVVLPHTPAELPALRLTTSIPTGD